jgi:hypothetical protein
VDFFNLAGLFSKTGGFFTAVIPLFSIIYGLIFGKKFIMRAYEKFTSDASKSEELVTKGDKEKKELME